MSFVRRQPLFGYHRRHVARLTWVIANVAPKPINSTNVNRAMRDFRTLFNGSVGDFDAGSLMR